MNPSLLTTPTKAIAKRTPTNKASVSKISRPLLGNDEREEREYHMESVEIKDDDEEWGPWIKRRSGAFHRRQRRMDDFQTKRKTAKIDELDLPPLVPMSPLSSLPTTTTTEGERSPRPIPTLEEVRGQILVEQNTEEWKRLRRGPAGIRIGASEAERACDCSQYAYARDLYDFIVASLEPDFDPRQWDTSNNVTEYGHMREDEAVQVYISVMKDVMGKNVIVKDGNYFPHPKLGDFYGASPDGQVFDAETGRLIGGLECKVPYFVPHHETRVGHLYRPHISDEYMSQMQFQMMCWTQIPHVDFCAVFFDSDPPMRSYNSCVPYEPGSRPLLSWVNVTRVFRSESYIQDWMLPRLLDFSNSLVQRRGPSRFATYDRIVPASKRPPVRTELIYHKPRDT